MVLDTGAVVGKWRWVSGGGKVVLDRGGGVSGDGQGGVAGDWCWTGDGGGKVALGEWW